MNSHVEHGYLVLADISGFDAYLAQSELEHAYGILQELLELIVDHLTPPLNLSSVEGDAVFAFSAAERIPRGETLLELTESTYAAFRDRLASIHRDNTCQCRACDAVPSLDLKFLVHFGEYSVEPVASGSLALGGLHANLVRERLLKEQAAGPNGARAYALFTEESLKQMGIRPEGMHEAQGEYPHVGQVRSSTLDLNERYQGLHEAQRTYLEAEEADAVLRQEVQAPLPVLWEWLNDPHKRTRWMRFRRWTAALRPGGRTGIGAQNHCAHGLGTIVETIRDWRPYEYFSVRMEQPSLGMYLEVTYDLSEGSSPEHSQLEVRMRVIEPTPGLVQGLLRSSIPPIFGRDLKRMARLIAEDESLETLPHPSA